MENMRAENIFPIFMFTVQCVRSSQRLRTGFTSLVNKFSKEKQKGKNRNLVAQKKGSVKMKWKDYNESFSVNNDEFIKEAIKSSTEN